MGQIRGSIEEPTGNESTKTALMEDMLIGAGEWVRCKARGSVGPETYIAEYFEDHARPRTQQIARYCEPPPPLKVPLSGIVPGGGCSPS